MDMNKNHWSLEYLPFKVDDTIFESDVLIKFHIKPELLSALNKKLADATCGEVQVQEEGEQYFSKEIEV